MQEQNTPQNRRNLGTSYNNVEALLGQKGDLDGILDLYRKSLNVAEQLVQEQNTPQNRRNFGTSYNNVGAVWSCRAAEMLQRLGRAIDEDKQTDEPELEWLSRWETLYQKRSADNGQLIGEYDGYANNNHFNVETMTQLGIVFEKEADARAFADVVEEEFEIRVGQGIGKVLSSRELQEFDAIDDLALVADWLESHCPGYKDIVCATRAKLEDELLRFREKIPGICLTAPQARNGILLEELGLSGRSG